MCHSLSFLSDKVHNADTPICTADSKDLPHRLKFEVSGDLHLKCRAFTGLIPSCF